MTRGGLYVGNTPNPDKEIKNQKTGQINGMEFDYFQIGEDLVYGFDSGFHPKAYGSEIFELYVKKGYESEMETTLSSIRRGGSRDFPLDDKSSGRRSVQPLPDEIKSFVSKCNFRWDLS